MDELYELIKEYISESKGEYANTDVDCIFYWYREELKEVIKDKYDLLPYFCYEYDILTKNISETPIVRSKTCSLKICVFDYIILSQYNLDFRYKDKYNLQYEEIIICFIK
ncbi:MAG: hypothetical protein Q4C64_05840 [Erysipelotrichia bacterium]|nr:hypothetical protein [Erysipelotrichia bacterium]